MANNTDSKYVMAIKTIGKPCTPRMIRAEVNSASTGEPDISPQNCASALNNLLARGKIVRDDSTGLYSLPIEHDTEEPI